MRDDFAVFILTHGRANNMFTLESLHKSGYTGRWYMLIDDEDKQREDYYRLFGRDNVIVFNKSETAKNMDECDIPRDRRSVVYARNATFDIATKMGLRYFMQLDDDYTNFRTRYEKDNALYSVYIKDFDSVIDALIEFLERTKAHSVCFAQSGDFIGGAGCNMRKKVLHRKAMNSFLCSTERAFKFIGRINEDVNTYVLEGSRGKLFFTVSDLCLDQHQTQKVGGGMTELYLSNGTYVKSFYTVMTSPSSVKIHAMGDTHFRIHHRVDWERAVPKIIRQEYKRYSKIIV